MIPETSISQESTPPDVHLTQVPRINRLPDKSIDMTLNTQRYLFASHEASELVSNGIQHLLRRIRHPRCAAFLLPDKVRRWIMHKGLQNIHQGVLMLSQQAEREFGRLTEGSFVAVRAHSVNHVVRETKRHQFRLLECETFVEETVKIDMEDTACIFP